MALSSFQDFLCRRNITGGCHPRLWSFVSSRLLASLHELLFVRKTDGKGPKRKREKFSPDSNNSIPVLQKAPKMRQALSAAFRRKH